MPLIVGFGLLVGKGVAMVLRRGLWKPLMLAFLMTYVLSLVILLGPVSRLLMVFFGCGIVLLIFPTRSLLGVTALWWCCGSG